VKHEDMIETMELAVRFLESPGLVFVTKPGQSASRSDVASKLREALTDLRCQVRLVPGPFVSGPNPDPAGFFWWLLAFGVHEALVEDGADFTQRNAIDMIERRFMFAKSSELRAQVIARPDDSAVATRHGYSSTEHYLAHRAKR
jgi:hypothetical protein